jgi:hypothetical protein
MLSDPENFDYVTEAKNIANESRQLIAKRKK